MAKALAVGATSSARICSSVTSVYQLFIGSSVGDRVSGVFVDLARDVNMESALKRIRVTYVLSQGKESSQMILAVRGLTPAVLCRVRTTSAERVEELRQDYFPREQYLLLARNAAPESWRQ